MYQIDCQPSTSYPTMQVDIQSRHNPVQRVRSSPMADITPGTRIVPSSLQDQSWTFNYESSNPGRSKGSDGENPHNTADARRVRDCEVTNLPPEKKSCYVSVIYLHSLPLAAKDLSHIISVESTNIQTSS